MVNRKTAVFILSVCVFCLAISFWSTAARSDNGNSGVVPEMERIYTSSGNTVRPVIGVVVFEYKYGNVGRGVASLLSTRLCNASLGVYKVASSSDVESALLDADIDASKVFSNRRSLDFSGVTGIDYLIIGSVKVFDIEETVRELGPLPLDFMLSKGALARIELDYSLVNTRENRIVVEDCVARERIHDDWDVPSFDTWKGSIDLMSLDFSRHPIGLPTLQALSEIIDSTTAGFRPAGRIVERTGATVIVSFLMPAELNVGDLLTVVSSEDRYNSEGQIVWHTFRNQGMLSVLEVRSGNVLCEILNGLESVKIGMYAKPAL